MRGAPASGGDSGYLAYLSREVPLTWLQDRLESFNMLIPGPFHRDSSSVTLGHDLSMLVF